VAKITILDESDKEAKERLIHSAKIHHQEQDHEPILKN
jgi:hypothetical protein